MPRKVIIDTDPGVDDILALLYAIASPELEIVAITLVSGNEYYKQHLARSKPIIGLGSQYPLNKDKMVDAAYFHGKDGLGNISQLSPELIPPPKSREEFFKDQSDFFTPDNRPIDQLLIDLIDEETTILSIGPITNLALAYNLDPVKFATVGEVIAMTGTILQPGNITPVAEFNCYSDPEALKVIVDGAKKNSFSLTLAPLDITLQHNMHKREFMAALPSDHETSASNYIKFVRGFVLSTIQKMYSIKGSSYDDSLEMHDPCCVYYLLLDPKQVQYSSIPVQVECHGVFTRGMVIADRRGLQTLKEGEDGEAHANIGGWLSHTEDGVKGTRIWSSTPGRKEFVKDFLQRLFNKDVSIVDEVSDLEIPNFQK